MKYVLTDEDVERAITAQKYELNKPLVVTGNRTNRIGRDKRAMRAALESFAQTLGEPVAVPDAITSHDAPEGMRYLSPFYSYMLGWNACREAMLAPHHPTTEKGCE